MRHLSLPSLAGFALLLSLGTTALSAYAQRISELPNAQSPQQHTAPSQQLAGSEKLLGNWVRPDGGYIIGIKSVDTSGEIDSMYFNQRPLPFAKAQATNEAGVLHLYFELQAGGYAGSNYDLTYDPASNQLKGTYYQAVAKQKYEVYFVRQPK